MVADKDENEDIDGMLKGNQENRFLGSVARLASLHRIRFVDYNPSSITAVALTPPTYDPSLHYPYLPSLVAGVGREILAVGRQNGSIEIYTWIGGERRLGKAAKKARRKGDSGGNRQGWVLQRVCLNIVHCSKEAF